MDAAIEAALNDLENISFLKDEQAVALKAFIEKKDVFAVLPTGFGKSLIYQLAPLVGRNLGLSEHPLIIVVSPLLTLMKDQIREATSMGLTAFQLGVHDDAEILSGQPQIIFGTPEQWVMKKQSRRMFSSDVFKDNLMGIVVDEVHLAYKWGLPSSKKATAFRESFSKLRELRGLVKEGTPVLALTASADLDSRKLVKKLLLMDNPNTVTLTVSPNRTNIRLGLIHVCQETLECLDWVVREVKDKGLSMSPILIYCTSMPALVRVFAYFQGELDTDAWVDRDPEQNPDNLLIGMFSSQTDDDTKSRIESSLFGEGSCRVVVATTALGLGLNFPNVHHVIMYGAPEDLESIVQQAGRAGRDGSQSHAAVYVVKQHRRTDEGVKGLLLKSKTGCIRKALYSSFEEGTTSVEPGHLCCTYCHAICDCPSEVCEELTPNYETLQLDEGPTRSRQVLPAHKLLIREKLEVYQESLVPRNAHLFTSQIGCTGFGTEVIDAVLQHSPHIFDLAYIRCNIPVFFERYAKLILTVIGDVFHDIDGIEDLETSDPSLLELPDMYYTGYFDEADDLDQMHTPLSSSESAMSLSGISGLSEMHSTD